MTKATNESTPKTASTTRVVAQAALPGEPDHALIDLWARCQRLWEV